MSAVEGVLSATWYFLDSKREQRGPVYGSALIQSCLAHQGSVTMVYACPQQGTGLSYTEGAWKLPSEVKELQQAILSKSQAMMAAQQQQQEAAEEDEEDQQEKAAKKAFLSGSDVAVSLKVLSSGAAVGKSTKRGREQEGEKERTGRNKASKKSKHNWVYVTGLPNDITEDEIMNHFTKVGILATSAHDQSPKIKLYRDEDGIPKGDCSLCYHSADSVALALSVLDGGYIRLNSQISVTKADFQSQPSSSKADNNSSKGTDKPSVSQMKVAQAAQRQALSWNDDDDGGGVRKRDLLTIVVLERAFDPMALARCEASQKEARLHALERKVAVNCGKFGEIDKITVYSKHPEGAVIVRFRTNYAAQQCKEQLHGQVWVTEPGDGAGLRTLYWDSKTDYGAETIDEVGIAQPQQQQEGKDKGEREGAEKEGSYADLFDGYGDDELPEELRLRTE